MVAAERGLAGASAVWPRSAPVSLVHKPRTCPKSVHVWLLPVSCRAWWEEAWEDVPGRAMPAVLEGA